MKLLEDRNSLEMGKKSRWVMMLMHVVKQIN
jgi:hypothetical protein